MSAPAAKPRLTRNTEPTLVGTYGSAWEQDIDKCLQLVPEDDRPPRELSVSSWIVRANYAHPIWSHYWIGCVALRNVEGWPPADIYLPGATHEVMVYALNPDHEPEVDGVPRLLHPANFHGQFIEPDDKAAAMRVRAAVNEVIEARLNPDTDNLRGWVRAFSDSNVKRPS